MNLITHESCDHRLRVLFDVSVLGAGYAHQRARTGVFRVVNFLAHSLAQRSDLELTWAAFGSPDHLNDVRRVMRDESLLNRPIDFSRSRRLFADAIGVPIHRLASSHLYPLIKHFVPFANQLRARAMFTPEMLARYDIIHSPFFPLPSLSRQKTGPIRFLTVYDLIPLKYPHWFDPGVSEIQKRALSSLTARDWIFCISDCTRRDLLDFIPELLPKQVIVTPLAASEHFRPNHDPARLLEIQSRYKLPRLARYFLSVCTLEPRKNLTRLLDAFFSLDKQLDDCYLVLVGAKGWQIDEMLQKVTGNDRVIVTGFVPDDDLAPLYSNSLAFVYPSLYEGFGLPPLEAMQCGVPVITSDVSSLPEVVGDAGILVSPFSHEEIAAAMLRVAHDDELRLRLAQKGLNRAKLFSWDQLGNATLEAYRTASTGLQSLQ
jgi:glycosyltransferase involved in cell wall biosynthesis